MQNCKKSVGTTAQKSSKCSLLFRTAALAAILLLCAVLSTKAQYTLSIDSAYYSGTWPKENTTIGRDTVSVMLLVSDTDIPNTVFYKKAFSVRKIEYINVDVSVDPNITTYLPGGGNMTTLMGRVTQYKERPIYTHLEYLDDKRLPLSKSIIVWQSVSK